MLALQVIWHIDFASHMILIAESVADQLSRLHMILKPFMLRRVKRDVENELSDKVTNILLLLGWAHCFMSLILN